VGTEFQANNYTTGDQVNPSVAMDSDGDFVVVWESSGQDGSSEGIFARRFDSAGALVGAEFQVNSYTTSSQSRPSVATDSDGGFIVVWESLGQDGSGRGVFAQRFGVIPSAENCPAIVDSTCTGGFSKGLLLIKEESGKEKLVAKLIKGPMIAQTDFGDPLAAAGTTYNLCIYDDTSVLVGELEVDRAGDTNCSGGAADCWASLGAASPDGRGYKYKDQDFTSSGVAKILLKGGPSSQGKSKIITKGGGSGLPLPVAGSLTATTEVTVQLHGNDAPGAGCWTITLTDVKQQLADSFKAR
jgi:hypothetical protein